MNYTPTTTIKQARITGTLFLLAFLAYGIGRNYFEQPDMQIKYLGAALITLNSIIVIFIGINLRKSLLQYNATVANAYLFTRILEALALASLLCTLLPAVKFSGDAGYNIGMFALGIGSIPMCYTLFKHRLAPSWLAWWGLIGYACLAFGFLMELIGLPWSMYFLLPGGLWELTFALWLLIKNGKYSTSS